VHKCYLPAGALSMRYRSLMTRSDQTSYTQLMERELGMDTAQAIFNLLSTKPALILADPAHELRELLVFFTVHYLMEHMCAVDFLGAFVLQACDLLAGHAALARTHELHARRRPRLVFLQQRVWLHDQGRLHACGGAVDAALRFMMMMRKAWKTGDAERAPIYNSAYGAKSIAPLSDAVLGAPVLVDLLNWS
jgi:hypothetical protein